MRPPISDRDQRERQGDRGRERDLRVHGGKPAPAPRQHHHCEQEPSCGRRRADQGQRLLLRPGEPALQPPGHPGAGPGLAGSQTPRSRQRPRAEAHWAPVFRGAGSGANKPRVNLYELPGRQPVLCDSVTAGATLASPAAVSAHYIVQFQWNNNRATGNACMDKRLVLRDANLHERGGNVSNRNFYQLLKKNLDRVLLSKTRNGMAIIRLTYLVK